MYEWSNKEGEIADDILVEKVGTWQIVMICSTLSMLIILIVIGYYYGVYDIYGVDITVP